MWCHQCKSEVEIDDGSADFAAAPAVAASARCPHCGNTLVAAERTTPSNRNADAIRNARAILERWQASDLLDRIQSTEKIPPLAWSRSPQPAATIDERPPATVDHFGTADNSDSPSGRYRPWQPKRETRNVAPAENPESAETNVCPVRSTRKPGAAETSSMAVVESDDPQHFAEPPDSAAVPQTTATTQTTAVNFFGVSQLMTSPGITIPRDTADRSQSTAMVRDVCTEESTQLPDTAEWLPDTAENSVRVTSDPVPLSSTDSRIIPLESEDSDGSMPAAESGLTTETEAVLVKQELPTDPAGPDADVQRPPVSNVRPDDVVRRMRIDEAESMARLTEVDGQRSRTRGKSRRRYIDEAHNAGTPGPHFTVNPPKRSNLTAMTGQFLAYLGVLGLTIGTAIVIYGHFGGYSEYTPTGWLVTTVAQMLLFLGVINLVSGGMEQTNDDVSRRINSLSEQLLRIEQATEHALRGPKLSPRLYAGEDVDTEEAHELSSRQSSDFT